METKTPIFDTSKTYYFGLKVSFNNEEWVFVPKNKNEISVGVYPIDGENWLNENDMVCCLDCGWDGNPNELLEGENGLFEMCPNCNSSTGIF